MEQSGLSASNSATSPAVSREWIVARLITASRAPQEWRGDELEPGQRMDREYTPASVLVPLVNREEGITVLLTQRTEHLADHAGQISFPGGRAEAGDENPETTALRETEEEIGLPRGRVEILGRLSTYYTVTGFCVTPVVGLIAPPFPLKLDAFEVAEVFEVPLSFFLDPANHQRHSRIYKGMQRRYYAMPYQRRYIWGATAGMLLNLYQVLHG